MMPTSTERELATLIAAVRASDARLDAATQAAVLARITGGADEPRPRIVAALIFPKPARQRWSRRLAVGVAGLALAAAATLVVVNLGSGPSDDSTDQGPTPSSGGSQRSIAPTQPGAAVRVKAGAATVVLDSDPKGLSVVLDGQQLDGTTPTMIEVAPGPHDLALREAGVELWRRKFVAAPGTRYEFAPAIPRAAVVRAAGGPAVVSPSTLEALRIAGDKNIFPDDATKSEIRRAGKTRMVIAVKLCVDAVGAVDVVKIIGTGSGFPAYDATIVAGVRAWQYRPFLVNGKGAPACSIVQFVYNQR